MSTLPAGGERRLNTFATGLAVTADRGDDGVTTTTLPDGRVLAHRDTPDARFGQLSPTSIVAETLPVTGTRTTTLERSVTLSSPADPFSITSLSETLTQNGISATRAFDGATRTWTATSAEGRTSTMVLDADGRTIQQTLGNLTAIDFGYDSFGRLDGVTQGTRITSFTYDSLGRLATATNPLSETTSYGYDAADRLTSITRPDALSVSFDYDTAGNMTEVVPPGRPAHTFTYTPMNQLASYTAPDVGLGPQTTSYGYDLDRALTSITFPDASAISHSYDTAGRLDTTTLPGGSVVHGYDGVTGMLTSMTGPYGVDLAFVYDGHLLTETSWSGALTGSVGWSYDSFFRLLSETVNGSSAITFGYDDDGLVTQAGDLSLSYELSVAGTESQLYLNIANVLDEQPPLIASAIGSPSVAALFWAIRHD